MADRLFDEYRKGLKPLVVEEWVDLLIYRPLGFFIAFPLQWTPITPNMVTFLSAFVGVVGAVFMGLGTYTWLLWGAWLYALSNVLDCSDGQLARMTGTFSRYGRIYDGVADYVVGLFTFIGLGIGWKPAGYSDLLWWSLIFFGGIVSTTWQGMHLNHTRQSYLRAIEHTEHGAKMVHRGAKKKKSKKRNLFYIPFYYLYRFYLSQERSVRLNVRLPLELPVEIRKTGSLRMLLILWTFTGKGTHVTLLAAFLLAGNPEGYLWFTLIAGNLWVVAARLGHRSVVKSLEKKLESYRHESSDSGRRPVGTDGENHSGDAQNAADRGESADTELDAERSDLERN